MAGEAAFGPGRVYPASGLPLQVPVPSDMIRMGMRVEDRRELQPLGIEGLPDLPSGLLVVAAVYQHRLPLSGPHKTYIGGALDDMRVPCDAD